MENVINLLQKRGFVKQCSGLVDLENLLAKEKIVYYVGFDPTADSLHVGSLVPIMAMAHLQKAGHKPICVIGGGTAMIGDPSGKTDMRKMLNREDVIKNGSKILDQIKKYLSLDNSNSIFVDNADWFLNLNYIDFLRDIGKFFKVNEMIKSEAYRQRLERQEGLSFIEFNYQILQAYDFLMLFDKYNCVLQMGGDDQWGNILAGVNLVRRMRNRSVCALTFPLLITARGNKMGKTEKGTIWLDAKKTAPYEFYQYWINVDDRDVVRFLNYFTLLSTEEILELSKLEGSDIRVAKEKLAYEVTKLAHGEAEAKKAKKSSSVIFSDEKRKEENSLPTTKIKLSELKSGITVVDMLCKTKLVDTKSEAKRLILQGGICVNGKKVITDSVMVNEEFLDNSIILIRRGKKQYHRVILEGEN